VKRMTMVLLIAAGSMFAAGSAAAEDFSHYSNDELSVMRHSMHNAAPEQQVAYRQEVRRRFGVEVNIGVDSTHHDDFWDDMGDHHDSYRDDTHRLDHHDGSYYRGYYYRSFRYRGSGGGC